MVRRSTHVVDPRGIPRELRALRRYTAWIFGEPTKPGGKPGKIPIQAHGPRRGRRAASTRPGEWTTCLEACRYWLDHRHDDQPTRGIQLMLSPERPTGVALVAIDLDDALTENLKAKPWARALLNTLPKAVYCARSYGGFGLHILVWAAKPTTKCMMLAPLGDGKIEVYNFAHPIAITGCRWPENAEALHGPPAVRNRRCSRR
jgi:hypothetical protein